jgi:uncharacterized protein YjbI with pentapeptide repeats
MDYIELIERYSSGERDFQGIDIQGAYLAETNLQHINLSNANLSNTDFYRTDLKGANLSGANLSSAFLSDADLREVNLKNANLSNANLSDLFLEDVYFWESRRTVLVRADLSGANLSNADLRRVLLDNADLSNADLRKAFLYGTNLSTANLQEAKLSDFTDYFNLGVDLRKSGDRQEAIKAWTEAIRLNSQNSHAYYERGVTRAEEGDPEGAIEDFNQVIKINPEYSNAYRQRDKTLNGAYTYTKLYNLLSAGRWREADLETYNLMQRHKVTNKGFDWLVVPSRDLKIIDQLWVQYSDGRFGFSVQKRIWEELHKRKDEVERIHGLEAWMRDTAGYDADYFIAFASEFEGRVGWCGELRACSYEGLTFDISAPEGHFPARCFYAEVYHEGLCGWLDKLAKKLS